MADVVLNVQPLHCIVFAEVYPSLDAQNVVFDLTLTLKKAKEAMPKDRNQLAAVGETYWLAGAGIGHRGEMPLEGELDIARDSLCGLPQVSGADENAAYKWRSTTFVPRALSLAASLRSTRVYRSGRDSGRSGLIWR